MKTALDFVRGAVATKELVPVLTHLHVYDGRIQGTNGRLTIDAPCPKLAGFHFTVPMVPFLKAVDGAGGEPELSVEDSGGKLRVKKGAFKALLPLADHDTFPRQGCEGEEAIEITQSVLKELFQLRPFIGEDASRPWACGVLFKGGNAYATCNVVLASVPTYRFAGVDHPLNLPGNLIDELARIKKEPTHVYATPDNITFKFPDGSWIKSQLLSSEWPDIDRFLPTLNGDGTPDFSGTEITQALLDAVVRITPFCPDPKCPIIKFGPDGVSTTEGDKSATVDGFNLPEALFRAETLTAVLKAATLLKIDDYPGPAPFVGPGGLRGVLVGVRQ